MQFTLESPTKAKLLDVVVLSQKNRQPDENPGAKLTVEMSLPNSCLSMFDGFLKSMLFAKAAGADSSSKAKQGTLEGVEAVSDMPALSGIGLKCGSLRWWHDLAGYNLLVDLGIGRKQSNLEIEGCSISGWKLTPKEGGTVIVKANIESADVSESAFGKLAKLKSREISITLTPPEEQQQAIDGAGAKARQEKAAKAPPLTPEAALAASAGASAH